LVLGKSGFFPELKQEQNKSFHHGGYGGASLHGEEIKRRVKGVEDLSNKRLDDLTFKTVIDCTPLISIDLVVRDGEGRVLLGQRLNRPAQGFWFVPGGRILKGESLADAFRRLTLVELGIEFDIADARYLGLYEHFYDDSIYTDESKGVEISTHYVVNGFEVVLPSADTVSANILPAYLPEEQHGAYYWFTKEKLMASDEVHVHSKWYFDKDKGF
jgi:colanic acid biosynthesis protein WcaH